MSIFVLRYAWYDNDLSPTQILSGLNAVGTVNMQLELRIGAARGKGEQSRAATRAARVHAVASTRPPPIP